MNGLVRITGLVSCAMLHMKYLLFCCVIVELWKVYIISMLEKWRTGFEEVTVIFLSTHRASLQQYFVCWDKIHDTHKLNEIYFGSQFQRFLSTIGQLQGRNSMLEGKCMQGKIIRHLLQPVYLWTPPWAVGGVFSAVTVQSFLREFLIQSDGQSRWPGSAELWVQVY